MSIALHTPAESSAGKSASAGKADVLSDGTASGREETAMEEGSILDVHWQRER
jgi:hypothetical protein